MTRWAAIRGLAHPRVARYERVPGPSRQGGRHGSAVLLRQSHILRIELGRVYCEQIAEFPPVAQSVLNSVCAALVLNETVSLGITVGPFDGLNSRSRSARAATSKS